ncbi:MAG TPA: hypothetical protein VH599_09145 [Ktedonobacterales bacterium]|jgi:hypothetical protein
MMNTPSGANPPTEEILKGTSVYDVNGDKIGHVTLSTLRDGYFVVEQGRLFTHELFLPGTAIQARNAMGITLRLSKEELKQEQWKQPPRESASGPSAQPTVPPSTPAPGPVVAEGEVIQMPPPENPPPVVDR